jgi:hypothetical protein
MAPEAGAPAERHRVASFDGLIRDFHLDLDSASHQDKQSPQWI